MPALRKGKRAVIVAEPLGQQCLTMATAAAQQVESGPSRTQDLSTAPEAKGAPRPPGFIDARSTMPRDEYFRAKARANALMREQGGRRRLPPGAVSQP